MKVVSPIDGPILFAFSGLRIFLVYLSSFTSHCRSENRREVVSASRERDRPEATSLFDLATRFYNGDLLTSFVDLFVQKLFKIFFFCIRCLFLGKFWTSFQEITPKVLSSKTVTPKNYNIFRIMAKTVSNARSLIDRDRRHHLFLSIDFSKVVY